MQTLPKYEVAAAIVSFTLIFVCGLAGQVAQRAGMEQKTADALVKCAILLLFFVSGLSCIGLMIHLLDGIRGSVSKFSCRAYLCVQPSDDHLCRIGKRILAFASHLLNSLPCSSVTPKAYTFM